MGVLLEYEFFCLLFFKLAAGFIRMQVLFEGWSLFRIYGMCNNLKQIDFSFDKSIEEKPK